MPYPRRFRSLHRQNHVCLDHQTASRALKPHCPVCGEPMRAMGTQWEIPQRTDLKGWRALARALRWSELRNVEPRLGVSVPLVRGQPSEYRASYQLRRVVRRPGA